MFVHKNHSCASHLHQHKVLVKTSLAFSIGLNEVLLKNSKRLEFLLFVVFKLYI